MTDPALRARLEQLGDDFEALLRPLQAWLHEARPVLEHYRTTNVVLDEAPGNPAWLVERPEAARVMGLALGAASLLAEVAQADEVAQAAGGAGGAGGWAYVEFLLGPAEAERLCGRNLPAQQAPQTPRLVSRAPSAAPAPAPAPEAAPRGPEPAGHSAPQAVAKAGAAAAAVVVPAGPGVAATPAAADAALEERLARMEADQRRLSTLVEAMSLALGAVGRTTADLIGRSAAEADASPAEAASSPQVVSASSHAA